jgi:hypothetical protein
MTCSVTSLRNTTSNLSEPVHQQLNMYALAAGAAGVSLLALAQPCEARIIYRHTNVVIGRGGVPSYDLDLNHDGITDFTISGGSNREPHTRGHAWLGETPAASNAAVGAKYCQSSQSCTLNASALSRGAKVGSGQRFYGGVGRMASIRCFTLGCKEWGYWRNVTNRYLGLKFLVREKRTMGGHG